MPYQLVSDKKWPDLQQTMLLRAALGSGDAALDAWIQWNNNNNLDAVDSSSFFVLPQVYLNLKKFGSDIPEYDRIKGVYRWTWSKNQSTIAGLADMLRLLNDAGIPTMILKGIPLARHYYKDLAARMMKDADLLVAAEDMAKVFTVLGDSAWKQQKRQPSAFLMPYLEAVHYIHPRWPTLDIHWRPFQLNTPSVNEGKLWDNSIEDSVLNVPTRMPSAADLLLSVCFHARKSDLHSACRWIADSIVLIREAQSSIDWDELFESSKTMGLLLPVRDAITYLYVEWDADIPEGSLQRAWNIPSSKSERARYRYMIQHGVNPSINDLVLEHWMRYCDVRSQQGQTSGVTGFGHYFFSHCLRQITRKSVPDLVQRFAWERGSRSKRA